MNKFIIKSGVFLLITLCLFLSILALSDGYTDPFYIRYTTPRQANIIVGNSRAAQGIIPTILDSLLRKNFFNYSFTLIHSPYGPDYLKSITKKTDPKTKNGTFIISIHPWSISSNIENPNDSTHFRERDKSVSTTNFVNANPNYEYLYENLSGKYHTAFSNKRSVMFLHDNGWLEIDIPNLSPEWIKNKTEKEAEMFRTDRLPNYNFSSLRLEYLKRTIKFFNSHGKVYLVRMPVDSNMLQMENQLMPNFDNIIAPLIPLTEGYLDLSRNEENYLLRDGSHLLPSGAKQVTKDIGQWIKEIEHH